MPSKECGCFYLDDKFTQRRHICRTHTIEENKEYPKKEIDKTTSEELKSLSRTMELIRDDLEAYRQFVDRNNEMAKILNCYEYKIMRIREESTRWKRGTNEQKYLARDLAIITDICDEKEVKPNSSQH